MSKTTSKPVTATDTKAVKQELVLEVDRTITRLGKTGTIIWIGDQAGAKSFKIRWADGSIEFFAEKDLQ